jgi:hypothetical protein
LKFFFQSQISIQGMVNELFSHFAAQFTF